MLTSLPTTLKRLGLTQAQVAVAAGVTEETVSRWVHGRFAPGGDKLVAVLAFVQERDPSITLSDLTGSAAA